jgi:hypothetical protein
MSSLAEQTDTGGIAPVGGFEPPNPDAVRGLNGFAAFLDAHDLPEATTRTSLSDLAIIAVAWAVVVLLLYYPQLHLLLLMAGAMLLGVRRLLRGKRDGLAPRHAPI